MEDVTLAAVCDLDGAKARAAVEKFGAGAAYHNAEEMLEREKLDFVDIATTMGSHAAHGTQESVLRVQQHWVDALRRGVEPETSGRDSLETYGLVFAAYESARTGRAVAPLK